MTVPYTFADASGNIPLSYLDANFSNVSAYTATSGSVVNASQPNIRSVGALTSLTVTGAVTGASFSGNHSGNGSSLSALNGANVTGFVANATHASNATSAITATSATTAGIVTVAAQPNITSVGILSNLTVANNIEATNLVINNISSDDSTFVTVQDGLDVNGNIRVSGGIAIDNDTVMISNVLRYTWVSNAAPTSGDGNVGDIWYQTF